jgi:hypothetical protein
VRISRLEWMGDNCTGCVLGGFELGELFDKCKAERGQQGIPECSQ